MIRYSPLKTRPGFSFAELLVVLIILGVLSGLAVPKIREMKRKSYVTTLITDLRNLSATQEQYWTDTYTYSNDFGVLRFNHSDMVTITIVTANDHGWSATATHLDVPITCSVFVGSAAPLAPAVEEAVVTCG